MAVMQGQLRNIMSRSGGKAEGFAFAGALFAALSLAAPASAFDPNSSATAKDPWAVFRFGFESHKSGDKEEAVEAYSYAAERGHAGAQWKLARMYAEGDGVKRDEYQAFRIFQKIVQSGADAGSPDESYVSDALVALAGYLRKGIPGSPVRRDSRGAQDLYLQAATMYGNSDAQYEIGTMMLESDKGPAGVRRAARWLDLASNKGHVGAQAVLGNLLFQSGRMVRGLAMMTAALERASASDRAWIGPLQERAFGLASENDRRTAMVLASEIIQTGARQ